MTNKPLIIVLSIIALIAGIALSADYMQKEIQKRVLEGQQQVINTIRASIINELQTKGYLEFPVQDQEGKTIIIKLVPQ